MLQKVVNALVAAFRFHKFKFFIVSVSSLVFAVLLFPYRDLGDLVTAKVADITSNQIYLRFDDLGLNIFPQPGLEMKNVSVETPFLAPLSAEALVVAPSIAGLISFRPGVSARATGLFGGVVSLSTRGSSKTEAGVRKQKVSVTTSRTNLSELGKFLNLALPLKGQMDVDLDTVIDPEFGEQPSGEMRIEIAKFELISGAVVTPFGPLNLPGVTLSHVRLSGKLVDGRFTIDEGKFGQAKDELTGTLKGEFMLRFERRGPQTAFIPGLYNLDIDMTVQTSLVQKATLFLSFLDNFKQTVPSGNRYAMHIAGTDFGAPPQMSALRSN